MEANYLVVSSVLFPRRAPLSGAPGLQIEAGSFGERRSDTERTRSSRGTSSTRQRTDTSCLRWKTKGVSQLCKVLLALNSVTDKDRRTSATFHLVLFRIDEDSRSGMVVNFELLHRFESDQVQSRIFELLDGAHLVRLHHYLLLAIHLQADTQQQARRHMEQENQRWAQNIS